MTRAQLKADAKQTLGGNIFSNPWLYALLAELIVGAVVGAAGSATIGIASLVLTGPLFFGLNYAYLQMVRTKEKMDFANLFKGFNNDFVDLILLGFLSGLFIALWSLLLVIPGIIKSYSYAMIYPIKADRPELTWQECITESRRMMDGHKWELFVLDLSFIGWYILGALCFGIGVLWVSPYHRTARINFYESIKG